MNDHSTIADEKPHCLITGGSGFLGQALVPTLLDNGWQVTVLTRHAEKTRQLFAAYSTAALSVTEELPPPPTWAFTEIINLAGANLFDQRWSENYKQTLRDSRIKTTEKLMQYIANVPAEHRPKLMLSGSAIGYYGARDPSTLLAESAAAGDDFAAKLCADWEAVAQQAEQYGVPVALLRTGIVLHSSGGALANLLPPFKMGLGGRLGDGEQAFSWITRTDWVAIVLFIVQQTLDANNAAAVAGAWNLTAPEPVSNRMFTKAVGQALSRSTVLPMPGWVLRLMLGEAAGLLLTGQRVIPQRAQASGYNFTSSHIKPALNKLLSK